MKKSLLKVGLSHALDTAGLSREHNLHLAKFWRLAISSVPGVICIAPWIDIASASTKPINRKTEKGKLLLSKTLEADVLINNLMDALVIVIADGGKLSDGQQFEHDTAVENKIPILKMFEYEIGELILEPEEFLIGLVEVIKKSKRKS